MSDRIAVGPADGRPSLLSSRLSLMMLLQYAAWGVWMPYLTNYLGAPVENGGLGFTNAQVGWIYGLAASIGALTAPLVAGQIADRFLNAELALGLLLILGGIVKYITFFAHDYETFLLLSVIYSVLYMPTLSLTNSIAFAHLSSPERQFPSIRVWGTFGWILASNIFPLLWLQENLTPQALPPFFSGAERADATARTADAMRVSGVIAVLYGLYCIVCLPKTPPRRASEHPLAFVGALSLLRHPGFLVVTLAAVPIAAVHQIYFIRSAPFLGAVGFEQQYAGPIMSIGQFSEILFLALLGFFLARLGYRWTLVLGGCAYVARFYVFGLATPENKEIVLLASALHGLCYGCFFAGAYLYVERVASADIRHSAQTVFGMIILGLGPIIGGWYNGEAVLSNEYYEPNQVPRFDAIWTNLAMVALASTLFIAIFFRPGAEEKNAATPASP